MARRAVGALAAVLALGAVALPAALVAGAAVPAAAAVAQQSQAPVVIAITSMSPQWAAPGATITVTGTLTNTSPDPDSRLIVQLLGSSTPVRSVTELQQSAAGIRELAYGFLPGASWQSPGVLRPGATASWSVRLPASALGMTSFGVYPLAAQAEDALGRPLASSLSYLPYMPDKNGPYGSTVPTPQKVSWVWPLIDQPLLDGPWQNACTGPQAAALAASLGSGGRLGQLLGAAATTAGSAVQAYAAESEPGQPATAQVARTQPVQSLASYDGVTWAIDPALLANVTSLAQCRGPAQAWAQTASAWLTKLKAATAGQPMFVTPYGDPDMSTVIGAGLAADLERSFTYGRLEAGQLLGRSLSPAPAGSTPAGQPDAAAVAWSAGEPASYGTLENLAAVDGVRSVLLSSSVFPFEQTSVLQTLDGSGSYVNVLLANESLTSLLGSANAGAGSGFATAQEFLAETALMAQEAPAVPIIVAPPQRWQPPAGLAAQLLTETASAPWLSPASLMSLPTAKGIPTVQTPADTGAPALSPAELSKLDSLDSAIAQLQALRVEPDPALYLAASTVESSAYEGRFKGAALSMIAALTSQIAAQQHGVHIIADSRVTLGGLRGTVPVSIDNRLGYPVQVKLQLSYSQAAETKITTAPPGLVSVPAHTAQVIRLRIAETQTGSTTITMTLANRAGQVLSGRPVRMIVQTTQVGSVAMIIGAVALGVFLLGSAARAIRRDRPRPSGGEPGDTRPSGDDEPGQSTGEALPDDTPHSELGTTGTPRPRLEETDDHARARA